MNYNASDCLFLKYTLRWQKKKKNPKNTFPGLGVEIYVENILYICLEKYSQLLNLYPLQPKGKKRLAFCLELSLLIATGQSRKTSH
jgi:hypothetical protein